MFGLITVICAGKVNSWHVGSLNVPSLISRVSQGEAGAVPSPRSDPNSFARSRSNGGSFVPTHSKWLTVPCWLNGTVSAHLPAPRHGDSGVQGWLPPGQVAPRAPAS